MKLQLTESGIRNIRSLSKEYNKAWIYFHLDMDGITSCIAMKAYLEQYGIEVTDVKPIQYGAMEYSIVKTPNNTLPVLVDFSHGKIFMKIHTDHHESQIQYPGASKNFRHSKSNAGTISTTISPTDVFSKEDVRVIDMVDSAGYSDEGIGLDELKNYIFNWNKDRSLVQNHLRFGMVVSKLLGAFKNKPGFLKNVIMNSKPSLVSIFNNIIGQMKENGWASLKDLQHNAEWYSKNQEQKVIPNGTLETIDSLKDGDNTVIGNTIVQYGAGNVKKSGAYDRYTAFKLHPDARFYIIIWPTIGMMQVSKNNWNKANRGDNINLGDIVLRDIFKNDFAPKMSGKKYDISLLAIKKTFEKDILSKDLQDSIGFDFNEFKALFRDLDLSEKQRAFIEKAMSLKPQELVPNEEDSEKKKAYKDKIINFLNSFKIPLTEIIMKSSGGHPGITNLTGFEFLNTQRRIFGALSHGENPYKPLPKDWKPDPTKPRKPSVTDTIMKEIAAAVVKRLNSLENVNESVDNGHDLDLHSGDTVEFFVPEDIKGDEYTVIRVDNPTDKNEKTYIFKHTDNKDGYSDSTMTMNANHISRFCKLVKPLELGDEYTDDMLNETKPSRFNKHMDDLDKSFATLSAERSMPSIDNREKQRKMNHRRTKVLEKLLQTWGLKGYIKTKGGFDEKNQPRVEINGSLSEEDSFFVPNITREQAIRLGKLFNQDSVMFKEKGSNTIKEIRTNKVAGDEGIGNDTGTTFIACQGRYNIGKDKTYYTRPSSSPVKFAFNPIDKIHQGDGSYKDLEK